MKIVSLLPSSTEICFLLELGPQIVGVSHECDYPSQAKGHPILTAAKIDPTAKSNEIDQAVNKLVEQGLSVYNVNESVLKDLKPDLIITQDTCEVCAVSLKEVEEATCRLLDSDTKIVSLSPLSFDDVMDDILKVGKAVGRFSLAKEKVASLRKRLDALKFKTKELPHPKVLMVEWMLPPMVAGHWTPELVKIAGGTPILGKANTPTGPIPWEEITNSGAEVIIIAPCGFKIDQSMQEIEEFVKHPGMKNLPAIKNNRLYIIDGNAYFNRPGPRLIESAEVLATAIHPELSEKFQFSNQDLIHYDTTKS